VGAVVAGLAVSFVLVIAVELFTGAVHPPPKGFTGTHEEVCRLVESYPPWVFAAAVPMWGFAAFAGTWTAGRLGNRWCAAIIGAFLVAMTVMNVSMLPYPLWFKIASPIVVLVSSVLAWCRSGCRDGSCNIKQQGIMDG
jgi:hypothetical protein